MHIVWFFIFPNPYSYIFMYLFPSFSLKSPVLAAAPDILQLLSYAVLPIYKPNYNYRQLFIYKHFPRKSFYPLLIYMILIISMNSDSLCSFLFYNDPLISIFIIGLFLFLNKISCPRCSSRHSIHLYFLPYVFYDFL